MKISIITPMFNEEKNINNYFKALNKIDYPKKEFEVIIINDGSTDNTLKELQKEKANSWINIRIINLEKNQGWIIARETGAKRAKYENLLFFDCKCEIFENALQEIKKINYQPLNGSAIQKNENIYDRFFFLIRKSIYKSHFNSEFEDFFVNKKTFNKTSKGTTIFFCNKNLFLLSQPKIKNKYVNDDTKLLWNIVQKKPILKTSKVKVYYITRKTFKDNFKHMLCRGPRFADQYYHANNKIFWLINLVFLSIIFAIYITISKSQYLAMLIAILIINTAISIYLAKTLKDFIICFCLFPILGITFLYGIIKGLVLKTFQTKNE